MEGREVQPVELQGSPDLHWPVPSCPDPDPDPPSTSEVLLSPADESMSSSLWFSA